MLNIGLGELLIVLLIAYVIVGPRDLPRVSRWLGRMVRRVRNMNREFRQASGWDDFVSETEEVRREMRDTASQAGFGGNPVSAPDEADHGESNTVLK